MCQMCEEAALYMAQLEAAGKQASTTPEANGARRGKAAAKPDETRTAEVIERVVRR